MKIFCKSIYYSKYSEDNKTSSISEGGEEELQRKRKDSFDED